ncbi:hypothetical protein SDC9_166647 [bioreactor metagenome]|uniref:Uncharacterized protein n=1 Tax=bioreactor metagenome TaxID=1076179 RepID=A0A645G048_9ZZZZ
MELDTHPLLKKRAGVREHRVRPEGKPRQGIAHPQVEKKEPGGGERCLGHAAAKLRPDGPATTHDGAAQQEADEGAGIGHVGREKVVQRATIDQTGVIAGAIEEAASIEPGFEAGRCGDGCSLGGMRHGQQQVGGVAQTGEGNPIDRIDEHLFGRTAPACFTRHDLKIAQSRPAMQRKIHDVATVCMRTVLSNAVHECRRTAEAGFLLSNFPRLVDTNIQRIVKLGPILDHSKRRRWLNRCRRRCAGCRCRETCSR